MARTGEDAPRLARRRAVMLLGLAFGALASASLAFTPAASASITAAAVQPAAIQPPTTCPTNAFALVNSSFEQPAIGDGWQTLPEDQVPGWLTTASDHQIEIWTSDYAGFAAPDGDQWAEINANSIGTLYQDVPTVPGTTVRYLVFHRGRGEVNSAQIGIGAPGQAPTLTRTMTDGPDAWEPYLGTYEVPAGQSVTRFAFTALTGSGPNESIGNFLDGMAFGAAGCLATALSGRDVNGGQLRPGDEIEYRATTTNQGGFAVFDPVVHFAPPAGTAYVPGSLRLVDGPEAGPLSDAADGDAGQVSADGAGSVRLGAGTPYALLRTEASRTFTFRVTVLDQPPEAIVQQVSASYNQGPGSDEDEAFSNVVALRVTGAAPTPTPTPSAGPASATASAAPPVAVSAPGPELAVTGPPRPVLAGTSASLVLLGVGLVLVGSSALAARRERAPKPRRHQ